MYRLEVEMGNALGGVEKACAEFHAHATSLKLIPATAKHANGVNFSLFALGKVLNADDATALDVKTRIKVTTRAFVMSERPACAAGVLRAALRQNERPDGAESES
jgi:hypothetical protein